MEERGNKTIMCSVLFLDIVEYSKKPVSGQISLKDRFNSYLSAAISSVPITDRIILDTGDGAAINFLGDVEDALKAALSLRESMLNEDPNVDPPLLVRVGINLGPVRLVRDINGQPNIVGDGINVAQRVMGFADAGQILVSRSYYDAVSRLSPQYAGMFHFQGSRTDKHVREHEVYAIGYPGDKTTQLASDAEQTSEHHAGVTWRVKFGWHLAAGKLGAAARGLVDRFKQAGPGQRALYAGAVAIAVALIGALVLKPAHNGEAPVLPSADQVQAASGIQPASAVSAAPLAGSKMPGAGGAQIAAKPDTKKPADQVKHPATQPKAKAAESARKGAVPAGADSSAEHFTEAYISIICKEGTQLYVDGAEKGKVVSTGLTAAVPPGKHKIIVTSKSGALYTQNVDLEPGKTAHIKPNFCD
ncbi:MAG: adenylate/guanylate cyclase domain-containing protein [Gallionella sp.]|nr:adenylate/guanylate cyclase domain-containing protein [Gallionella sp.]